MGSPAGMLRLVVWLAMTCLTVRMMGQAGSGQSKVSDALLQTGSQLA